jgi:DNA-directed RNA polymerase subunit L
MKLRIMKDEDGHLEMEVGGEGHTLLNLLQSSLLSNNEVKMAGYSKPHPLMDRSVLRIDTEKGKSTEKTLLTAAEDAKKLVSEFKILFEEEVEKLRKEE